MPGKSGDWMDIANRASTSRLLHMSLAAGQRSGDLLAVEAPIFNEDFTRMVSADHDSRQKYARHIALRAFADASLVCSSRDPAKCPGSAKNSKSGW